MAKSDLARRLQTRMTELDVDLQKLESAGKVKLWEGLEWKILRGSGGTWSREPCKDENL